MSTTKVSSNMIDLTDNFAFTGTVTGAGGGAWTFISTNSFSGQSSVTVTGIDTTYAIYVVVCTGIINADDGVSAVLMQLGDSGGIDSGGSDYSYHSARAESGGSGYAASNSAGAAYIEVAGGTGNAAGEGATSVSYIVPHASIRPLVYGTGAWIGTTGYSVTGTHAGQRLASITVTQFLIKPGSGSITGRISLYGIKHS
jgi:hypothetical protein